MGFEMKLYPFYSKIPAQFVAIAQALLSASGSTRQNFFRRGLYVSFLAIGSNGKVLAESLPRRFIRREEYTTLLVSPNNEPVLSVRLKAVTYRAGGLYRQVTFRVPFSFKRKLDRVEVRMPTAADTRGKNSLVGAFR
jgi:hypothetical protein